MLFGVAFCNASFGDGIPLAYTVTFGYTYKWFNVNSGKVLIENRVGCKVSVDGGNVLIQPYSLVGVTNVVFHVWATSPFRSNEWIVGGETMSPTDTIKNIWLDTNPTRSCSDLTCAFGKRAERKRPSASPLPRGIRCAGSSQPDKALGGSRFLR